MPIFYHYTDEEGAKNIIRSGTIQASLKHMTRGDTAHGNGVYLTSLNPWTSSKDEIMINNWGNKSTTTSEKMKRVFILSIPKADIKKAEKTRRDIYLFGYRNDLRLHKYPWLLKCYISDRIIASYKYEVVSRECKLDPLALVPTRHEDYIGDYIMSDEIVNGSPVYESSKNYLFMGSDGNWYLGPDVKRPKIGQECNFSLGPKVAGKWKWRSSDGVRTTDSRLEIRACSLTVKPSDCYLSDLHKQLADLVASKPGARRDAQEDKAEDPKVQPIVWVSSWVDYSDKYGFGYALNDDSIGVVFNDRTKVLLLAGGPNIIYVNYGGDEHHYTVNEFPPTLEKKMKLLDYFRNYVKNHLLLKTCTNTDVQEEYQLSRIPALKSWLRTSRAVIMHLTNGTVQINFFKDHTKIILCPLQGAVTYIDETKKKRTFRFDLLEKYGCSPELSSRLIFAHQKINVMIKETGDKKETKLLLNPAGPIYVYKKINVMIKETGAKKETKRLLNPAGPIYVYKKTNVINSASGSVH